MTHTLVISFLLAILNINSCGENAALPAKNRLTARAVDNTFFIKPAAQLELVRDRNKERNWGFTNQDFKALGESPAWPDGKLSAVVLDVSLENVQRTFEEAWYFAASVQPSNCRWKRIESDADHLRLLPGITHKRGLRWRVIDLASNWDRKKGISPADVRDSNASPNSAVLWAASYFPKWVQAMDGVGVPFVWIPGYEVTIPSNIHVPRVFYLSWHHCSQRIELDTSGPDVRDPYWAVPTFR